MTQVRLAIIGATVLLTLIVAAVVHTLFEASKGGRYTAADGAIERAERIAGDAALRRELEALRAHIGASAPAPGSSVESLQEAIARLPEGVPCDGTYTCDGRPRCEALARHMGRPVGEDERDRAWLLHEGRP